MNGCTKTVTPDDASRLQEILDELPSGAVLCLAPGRYPSRLVLRRSVTLRGQGGAGAVIVDAEGHGSAVKLDAAKLQVTLEQLTITGGGAKGGGGGVSWLKASDLVLRDVIIRDNGAPKFGGGGIEASLGSVTLERCRIEDNLAPIGAGILAHTWVKLTLRDSLVAGNRGKSCGGLAIQGGAEVLVERSTVAGNRGQYAIDLQGESDHAPTLVISDSIVAGEPGALANDEGSPAKVRLSRSVLHGRANLVAGAGDYTVAAGEAFVDGGGNRVADPRLDEGHRPKAGSPAIGLGQRPAAAARDLAGRPRANTAGALEPLD